MSTTRTVSHLHLVIPLRLPVLTNTRMHWRTLDREKRRQKEMTWGHLYTARVPVLPAIITLTRIGKRKLDDDNLAGAFKYVRDCVAEWCGVDDGSPLYQWRYEQRVGKEYAIEIAIERRTP